MISCFFVPLKSIGNAAAGTVSTDYTMTLLNYVISGFKYSQWLSSPFVKDQIPMMMEEALLIFQHPPPSSYLFFCKYAGLY